MIVGGTILPVARSGRDDGDSARFNPNRGSARVGRMTPAPRVRDGVRRPVTVSWGTARYPSRSLGRLPVARARRAPWTVSRMLEVAIRAESRGHHRLAATILDHATLVERRA